MAQSANAVERWLSQARAGSREALGQALDACRGYLLLIAQEQLDPTLQAKGGASDLVQETFLEAQRDFSRFHGHTEEELLAWLRQLLLHNLANFARSYRRTRMRQVDREVRLSGGRLAGEGPSPATEAESQEQAELLQRALDRLPDNYRRVLTLRYQEDRSFTEIGELMGRSPNAVRKLFARAVARMHLELSRPS
jgi:RNA polymerase sigma-70 factor (ECF subfamily)